MAECDSYKCVDTFSHLLLVPEKPMWKIGYRYSCRRIRTNYNYFPGIRYEYSSAHFISFHLFANNACGLGTDRHLWRIGTQHKCATQSHCNLHYNSETIVSPFFVHTLWMCPATKTTNMLFALHSKALLRLLIFGFNQWILCCGIHRGYWKRDTQTTQLTQIYVMLAFLCERKKQHTTDEKNSNSHTQIECCEFSQIFVAFSVRRTAAACPTRVWHQN